jgi:hypothetical protein
MRQRSLLIAAVGLIQLQRLLEVGDTGGADQ